MLRLFKMKSGYYRMLPIHEVSLYHNLPSIALSGMKSRAIRKMGLDAIPITFIAHAVPLLDDFEWAGS